MDLMTPGSVEMMSDDSASLQNVSVIGSADGDDARATFDQLWSPSFERPAHHYYCDSYFFLIFIS